MDSTPRLPFADRPRPPVAPTDHTLALRAATVGELATALRFTGLTVSIIRGHTVVHPINQGEQT